MLCQPLARPIVAYLNSIDTIKFNLASSSILTFSCDIFYVYCWHHSSKPILYSSHRTHFQHDTSFFIFILSLCHSGKRYSPIHFHFSVMVAQFSLFRNFETINFEEIYFVNVFLASSLLLLWSDVNFEIFSRYSESQSHLINLNRFPIIRCYYRISL